MVLFPISCASKVPPFGFQPFMQGDDDLVRSQSEGALGRFYLLMQLCNVKEVSEAFLVNDLDLERLLCKLNVNHLLSDDALRARGSFELLSLNVDLHFGFLVVPQILSDLLRSF